MNRRPFTTTFLALGLAGLLAGACSGESGSSAADDLSAAQKAELERETDFARCIRQEGLEDFPDPEVNDDGYVMTGFPFEDQREDFMAAQEACQHVFENAGEDDPENEEGPEEEEEGAAVDPATWQEVTPGGDCQCTDGSEFNLWVHQGDPNKVLFFLEDGGACFSAETCDPENELYHVSITEGPDSEGIFDFADERNPFSDWSVVFVPYCSGDVFLGDATTEYGPDLTIQHKGYANGTAGLDHLSTNFPAATEIVVAGESAGSVAAPLYGGLVSDRFPDARTTVIADGSGSYPGAPELTSQIAPAWGTAGTMPDWPENAGLTAEQWTSFPGLFVQSGRHDPDIVFARHDYAYDERQAEWYPRIPIDTGDLLARMDANEAQVEAAGVNLLSYIAPGNAHTALTERQFYTEEVEGQSLLDWVTGLITGQPVADVHCDDCAAG